MTPRVPALLFVALADAATLTAEALAAAPRYRMVLDASNAEQGVKTVSLVKSPAIQRGWVALSAVEPTAPAAKRFHLSADGQQQVLTGPALIPGQEILRLDEKGNPFYITFDAANIQAIQRQYAKQLRQTNSNEDHLTDLDGNVVEESWIIADAACDKAVALGLDPLPAGTWMLSMHVPDADYWQKEIISGNKLGFSIEGLFNTEQLNLSAAAPAQPPVKKNWVTTLFAALKSLGSQDANAVAVALGLVQLADGRAVNIDDTTGAVTVVGPDGTPGQPLEDGTHALADGGELIVQGGVQKAGEQPPADPSQQLASDAAPAPLGADATPADMVAAINALIKAVSKDAADDPAQGQHHPPAAGQPIAQALHGVKLADVAPVLTALKLDAIELVDGEKLTLNPVSRRLTNADGSLVESGYFAAADGSYFCVSTDQWFYQIDKQTYDSVYAKLSADARIQELEAKLAKQPASQRVLLNGELNQPSEDLPPHLAHLQAVRAANAK